MLDSNRVWELLLKHRLGRRWTQDSPIRPDVWQLFLGDEEAVSVLLIPLRGVSPGTLHHALVGLDGCPRLAYNQSTVCGKMSLEQIIEFALPYSAWWCEHGRGEFEKVHEALGADPSDRKAKTFAKKMRPGPKSSPERTALYDFVLTVGFIRRVRGIENRTQESVEKLADEEFNNLQAGYDLLLSLRVDTPRRKLLFAISPNRSASVASLESGRTIKADAARRVFDLDFSRLMWAVLDTGIDATHVCFEDVDVSAEAPPSPSTKKKKKKGTKKTGGKTKPNFRSRVVETFDFTSIQEILELASSPDVDDQALLVEKFGIPDELARELRIALVDGRDIDWNRLALVLRVDDPQTSTPEHPHGTHVAGILGAGPYRSEGGPADAEPNEGMCPNIKLLDLRVLDEHGEGDEFMIISALQYVRHRNAHKERPVIHGVNMSLQLPHNVRAYACGRTPLCDETERVVATGVVAVAAAGNFGFGPTGAPVAALDDQLGGYENSSITDPGNAEAVITVGATHGSKPHTFGVSFFSSRGPTGDGRIKPDVVAPGEKIVGPVPGGGTQVMDGTSQAAPHVSGAAAMLMARNEELVGEPRRIKEILCGSATDLGRERYFQGCGLVDVLRALQSV